MMGTAQEQALGTKTFRLNKALFRRYNTMDGALKKYIATAVRPVFLSLLVDQLTIFVQVSALAMLQHLFTSYGEIDKLDLEENAVNNNGDL